MHERITCACPYRDRSSLSGRVAGCRARAGLLLMGRWPPPPPSAASCRSCPWSTACTCSRTSHPHPPPPRTLHPPPPHTHTLPLPHSSNVHRPVHVPHAWRPQGGRSRHHRRRGRQRQPLRGSLVRVRRGGARQGPGLRGGGLGPAASSERPTAAAAAGVPGRAVGQGAAGWVFGSGGGGRERGRGRERGGNVGKGAAHTS